MTWCTGAWTGFVPPGHSAWATHSAGTTAMVSTTLTRCTIYHLLTHPPIHPPTHPAMRTLPRAPSRTPAHTRPPTHALPHTMAASKAKVDSKFQSKAKQSRWFWLTLDFIQFQSKAKQRATKSKGISKVPKWGLRERRPRLHPLVGRSPHGT